MRRLIVLPVLGVAAAATLAISGAADGGGAESPTVDEFVSLASSGVHVDFSPLTSPRDAVDKGDLLVEGTLVDVLDGIRLEYPNPTYTQRKANSYATLAIDVDTVIDGALAGDRVYVAVVKSASATPARLAAANPRPKVVAVLDDITAWAPAPGVKVQRPAAMPDGAPLYAPFTDGLWLQAAGDPEAQGLGAHLEELSPAWGSPQHVAELSTSLRRASGR